MKLTIFDNKKGLVRGKNSSCIISEYGGVLKIGNSSIQIAARNMTALPILCDGQTGEFEATFTDENGNVYNLFNVNLADGIIVQPSAEYEELGVLHKRINFISKRIKYLSDELEKNNTQKQEAVNALNNHPLKSLIE